MKNYYEILEVNPKASKEIIEKAYRVLVKKYHPDLQTKQADEQRLRDLNEAYNVLTDDFLRNQYDNELFKEKQLKEQTKYNNFQENSNNKQLNNRFNKMFNKREVDESSVGTIGSMVALTRQIFSNRPRYEKKEKWEKKDFLSIGLTVIIVIIIGIIMWFIPFTNEFIRQLIFDTPLWSWIWK